MTKSEVFKKAHSIAKNIVAVVGDYMISLSIALKEVYKMTEKTTEQKLIELGCNVWEKYGKKRIYIGDNIESVFGLKINYYGTGNISSAYLNGEKISNSKARKLIDNPFYDCVSGEFFGSELTPII